MRSTLPPLVVRVNRDLHGEFEKEREQRRGTDPDLKRDLEVLAVLRVRFYYEEIGSFILFRISHQYNFTSS